MIRRPSPPVLILLGVTALVRADATPTPDALRAVGFDQNLNVQIDPSLTFTDEQGRTVHLADYFGDTPIVLTLVYFKCPMLCSLIMDGVVKSLQDLPFDAGKQYQWVVVSFDPSESSDLARTTKNTLAARYAHEGAEDGWHFLVGDPNDIKALADAVGFRYSYDEATGQFAHPAGITVLTPEGTISKYFFGTDFKPGDLRLGLVDASDGTIGSLTDQVLLRCYCYNPLTGKYDLAIMSGVRIAGIAMTIVLVGLVAWLLHRERARAREVPAA